MSNTGWQICRSILSVASSDNSKLLDRDGFECNLLNTQGIPVSASGKKQAAKVWSGVNVNTDIVPGFSNTYSNRYDIVGTYTVTTVGVSTTSLIYQDGVVVGRWKGDIGGTCEIPRVIIFSTSPQLATLIPEGSTTPISFGVTSTINGTNTNWVVTSSPSWIVVEKTNSSLIRIMSYPSNTTSGTRTGNILLTQSGGATVSISVTQGNVLIINRISLSTIPSGTVDGTNYTLTAQFAVTSQLTVRIRLSYDLGAVFEQDINFPQGETSVSGYDGVHETPEQLLSIAEILSITPSTDGTYSYQPI